MKGRSLLLVAATALCPIGAYAQKVNVYVSPNDIQSAEDSGIMGVTPDQIFTETFNDVPTGSVNGYTSSAIGVTYSDWGGNIQSNNKYGGYDSGNYLGVTPLTSTVMTLATPAQYFGFYFTAGDEFNMIDIYSGSKLLLSFSTQSLIDMLPKTDGSHITAINGDTYLTKDYYGQPTSNENDYEPYAYLHFVTFGSTTFDKIVLTQGHDAIFENDNHSILTTTPVIPDSLVKVPTSVPEGGPGALAMSLLVGSLGFFRKRFF